MDGSAIYNSPPASEQEDKHEFQVPDEADGHMPLEGFQNAVRTAYDKARPKDMFSRYSNVYVLLLSWEYVKPEEPFSREVEALKKVFEKGYKFSVEVWKIRRHKSHYALARKIMYFVALNDDSKDD